MKTQQSETTFCPWMALIMVLISIGILSCSKDKNTAEPEIDAKNELTYNGQAYPLNYGAIDDYEYDGSHTNYEFHLFSLISETDPVVPIYIFFDLFSPNATGFSGGTFHYIDTDNGEVDLEGKYYFDDGYLGQDINVEDNTVGEVLHIKSGTVNVSGSGMDYTLAFGLTLDNGKSVKGSYVGTFQPLNETNAVSRSQPLIILNKWSTYKPKK